MSELARQIALFNEIISDKYKEDFNNGITVYQRHFQTNFLNLLSQKYPILKWLIGEKNFIMINYNYFLQYPTNSGNITTYGDQLDLYFKDISIDEFNTSFLIDLIKFEKQLYYCSVISEFERELVDLSVFSKYDPSSFTLTFVKHLIFFKTVWPLIEVYNTYKSNQYSKPLITPSNHTCSIAMYFFNTVDGFKLQIEECDENYSLFHHYLENHSLFDAIELMNDEFDFNQWLTYVTSKNLISGVLFLEK